MAIAPRKAFMLLIGITVLASLAYVNLIGFSMGRSTPTGAHQVPRGHHGVATRPADQGHLPSDVKDASGPQEYREVEREDAPGVQESIYSVGLNGSASQRRMTSRIRDYHMIQSYTGFTARRGFHRDDVTETLRMPRQAINAELPVKLILFWNSFREKKDFNFGLGRSPFKQANCPVNSCMTTTDKSLIGQADAVLFHTRDMKLLANPTAFPARGHPKQVNVFLNLEAPIRIFDELKPFNDIFNVTMTYRLDSDIPMRHVPFWPRPASIPYQALTPKTLAAKNKPILWVISHCEKDESRRVEYVQELSKYIEVDIFGACGKPGCPAGRAGSQICLMKAEQQYRFYLSLENCVCRDYVTEKVSRAMSQNVVPIVLGGLDYDRELPSHSFIKVTDFKSPKHLADYLHFLMKNDEEYLKYLEWKRHYMCGSLGWINSFCDLCQLLNDDQYPYRETPLDIYKWWNTDANCSSAAELDKQLGLEQQQ